MIFRLQRPTDAEIAAILESQRNAPLSYQSFAGMNVDRNRTQLGSGPAVLAVAKSALQTWKMVDLGWLRLVASEPEVAIVVRHSGFWSIHVNRVLGTEETESGYALRWGTLSHHAESGEERFAVTLRADRSVWYEIEAHSRPRHLLAKICYPWSRALQRRFARDSLRKMRLLSAADGLC